MTLINQLIELTRDCKPEPTRRKGNAPFIFSEESVEVGRNSKGSSPGERGKLQEKLTPDEF